MKLCAPKDYNEFSKAINGDEETFGKTPEAVMTAGQEFGDEFEGKKATTMGYAVAIWAYVTYFDSNLPSMHDYMTGQWNPRSSESAAGLRQLDFCTGMSLV